MARVDPLLDLLRDATQGDPRALRRLLDAVSPSVHRVARTVLGVSSADAVDAAQEGLVAFAGALDRFRGDSGVLHYACRIALHVAVSARRRRATRRATERTAADEGGVARGAPRVPDEELAAARRRDAVLSLIDELSEAQAETLALRFVLGCSLREVAEATGVPENTVRSRLRLAKEALRRRIAEDPALAGLLTEAG